MLDAFRENLWFLLSVIFLLGLVVGSFLNVVIYRLPLMMERQWRSDCSDLLEIQQSDNQPSLSLVFPNSHCPACKHAIRPWENIPLISYLFLRGKCSQCSTHISPRYPAIELCTAVLSLLLALYFGASTALVGCLLLTWTLIALSMIDIDHTLLPDNLTLPLLWLGLLFNLHATFVPLHDAVIGAVAGYLILWSVYWLFKLLTGKEGMGYGDFKLLAALGAWLGWQALPLIILMSSAVGAFIGIMLLIAKRRGKDIPIPFGPYLAAAGWITLMWGDTITSSYFQLAGF